MEKPDNTGMAEMEAAHNEAERKKKKRRDEFVLRWTSASVAGQGQILFELIDELSKKIDAHLRD